MNIKAAAKHILRHGRKLYFASFNLQASSLKQELFALCFIFFSVFCFSKIVSGHLIFYRVNQK